MNEQNRETRRGKIKTEATNLKQRNKHKNNQNNQKTARQRKTTSYYQVREHPDEPQSKMVGSLV
jgi:hypothetical protein